MKFEIDRKKFLDSLTKSARASLKNSSTILYCVRIEANSDSVLTSCTDMLASVTCATNAHVIEEGVVLVDARQLIDVVRVSSDDVLEIYASKNKMILSSKSSKARLSTIDASEYPENPTFPENKDQFTVVQGSHLERLVKRVALSASVDQIRPILTGMRISPGMAICTDGFRASILYDGLGDATGIYPASSLKMAASIFGSDDEIFVGRDPGNENRIILFNDEKMCSILGMDGNFPDVEGVLAASYKNVSNVAIASTISIASACDQVGVVLGKQSDNTVSTGIVISGDVGRQKMVFIGKSDNGAMRVELDAEILSDFRIGVSFKFMKDAVSAIEDDRFSMKVSSGKSPIVLEPADTDSSSNRRQVQIVMPMDIRNIQESDMVVDEEDEEVEYVAG